MMVLKYHVQKLMHVAISPDIIEFLGWNKNDKIELVTSGNSKDWKIICNNKSQKTTHNS